MPSRFWLTAAAVCMPCLRTQPSWIYRGGSIPFLQSVVARDDHAMHFRGSGIDRARDRVPQFPFQFVLDHIAVTAVQLNRFQTALNAGFADVRLCDRSLAYRMPAVTLETCSLVERQPPGLEANVHVGDLVVDGRKFSDRLAELLALFRVLDAGFHDALHRAEMTGQDANPLPLH